LLGHHEGLMYYTLGQRQGLHIGGVAGAREAPWYVAAKDMSSNTLIAVQGSDHPLLYSRSLWLENPPHWINESPRLPLRCTAKTRYRQPDQACTLAADGTRLRAIFEQPQWAVTPGQSAVFYQDARCLGGGVIEATEPA